MKLIFICSPYRGDMELNTARARRYCHFAYAEGYVPFAPHIHNTQFLEDGMFEEREAGILLGLEVLCKCDELWLFGSLLTEGMETELKMALRLKKHVRYFNDKCQEVEKNE